MSNNDPSIEELLGDDHFDDSILQQHQRELREEALQAYDRSQQDAPDATTRVWSRIFSSDYASSMLGYSAIVAALLLGLLTWWISASIESPHGVNTPNQKVTSVPDDSGLVESLAALEAYRDDGSREALFNAISMCQRDYEGRVLFEFAGD